MFFLGRQRSVWRLERHCLSRHGNFKSVACCVMLRCSDNPVLTVSSGSTTARGKEHNKHIPSRVITLLLEPLHSFQTHYTSSRASLLPLTLPRVTWFPQECGGFLGDRQAVSHTTFFQVRVMVQSWVATSLQTDFFVSLLPSPFSLSLLP